MAGQEALPSQSEADPEQRSGLSAKLRQVSDRTPLRTKLTAAVLALVIMALAIISLTGIYVLRSYLTSQDDNQVASAYQYITRQLESGAGFPVVNTFFPVGGGHPYAYVGLQLYGQHLVPQTPSGGTTFSGGSMGQGSVPAVPSTQAWATANAGNFLTLGAQSGTDTWRVVVSPYSLNGMSGTVVVGYDLGDIGGAILQLTKVDFAVSGAIILVLALAAIGLVRANLRPLNDIELTAGQIAAGHLDHRVPEGDPRTEVGSLSRSLNAMLSQVERAFHAQGQAEQAAHQSEERMRRFIADAAHELRTPLTTIRGFAAHYRLRGGAGRLRPGSPAPADAGAAGGTAAASAAAGAGQDPVLRTDSAFTGPAGSARGGPTLEGLSPDELDHLMSRVESEATRMGLLVEDLLTLARLDQQRPITKAPVDLLTLAADAVQDARIVAPGRPIDLIVAPGTAFLIDGDEPRLRQVLANLVNNAITHTPAGTPVRVKIARAALEAGASAGATGSGGAQGSGQAVPAVVLDVEDDGPGMTAEQAQRVFERFYRADAARNRASGGTGLGLAIVAGLVSAHGGTVSVRTAPGRGADFQVKLPLSPDAFPIDDADDADDADLPGS
jgi:two-component system OmpR family sensor kinase